MVLDAEADQARRNAWTAPSDRARSTKTGTEAGAAPTASAEAAAAPTGSATAAPMDELCVLNGALPKLRRRGGASGAGQSNR